MAVGPNHILAVINVAFAVYDKSGNLLRGPTTFASFFSGTPGCSNTGVFDPNVVYDESTDRFILGIDGDGSDYCVAATQGSDPLAGWNRYGFATNISGAFFDFPHAGVGRDAIYVGSNQFLGSFFLEGRVFAIDKAALYAGSSLSVISRSTNSGSAPQPMNLHGFNQGTWPTSGPHYIMTDEFDGTTHTIWSWSDPFGANVFTNEGDVDLNSATGVTAGFPIDTPQAGSSELIQANDWRGLDAEYRDGEIWMSNTIACNPGGGTVNCIRWARIDPTGPAVIDAGIFASPGEYRFFPDLAVNSCGDMAIGYAKSGSSLFPSIWVTGREAGDPAGSLQTETQMKAGEVAYDSFQGAGPHRWGDYTGMTIDPDGQTFWYLGEYSKDIAGLSTKWGNFIGSFEFPACAGTNTAPVVTITAPDDGSGFNAGTSIAFSGSAQDSEDGDLTSSLTWTSSLDGEIGSGGSFSAVLSNGTHVITASVTDGGGLPGSASVTVTVSAAGNTPPTVTITSPSDGASFTQGASIAFSGTAEDAENGDLSSVLSWTSDLDGPIGTGGSFSTTLSIGTHLITAAVTDSGGLSGSDSISVTVNPSGGGTAEATFLSIGADDGLVVESSETSDQGGLTESNAGNVVALRVGDLNGDVQVKSFLSFDTSSLPADATILSATLRLRRGIVRGSNPFGLLGDCLADIQSGSFSGNRATQSTDFQATATAVGVASLSNAAADGDWSAGSLNSAGLAAINLTGLTQFRIYFTIDDNDDGSSDFIGYRSGNDADADSRPQLILTYSEPGGGGNSAPTVSISSPPDGSSFTSGTSISFAGSASDAEQGDLTASLTWSSSLDGAIGSGGSFSTSGLSNGTHLITASVTDSGGLGGSDQITVNVNAPVNTPPSVTITSPTDGATFIEGTSISFAGAAGDAEDGDLTASLAWTSDLDGSIGSGGSFTTPLSVGTHVVTASVTDTGGLAGSDSVTVTVNPSGGTPQEETFTSIASDDGLVVETAENSDIGGLFDSTNANVVALRVGDLNGDLQVKSFVSFDTSSIPDGATILSATLRLRRGILRGTDPFTTHGPCLADIRTGAFNDNPALESNDFQAAATATGVMILSDATANGDWSEGTLDSAGLAALNKSGLTQFRIYFALDDNDDGSSDFIGYRSGDDSDASSRPELIVVYQP